MDARSERNLYGVHPDLVKVVRAAEKDWCVDGIGLIVTEGVRTLVRQGELMKSGATRTMNSRHLTGHAVDLAILVNNEVRWDWPLYFRLGAVVKTNARSLSVPITWGGDWRTLRDGPHYELDWKAYPNDPANDRRFA